MAETELPAEQEKPTKPDHDINVSPAEGSHHRFRSLRHRLTPRLKKQTNAGIPIEASGVDSDILIDDPEVEIPEDFDLNLGHLGTREEININDTVAEYQKAIAALRRIEADDPDGYKALKRQVEAKREALKQKPERIFTEEDRARHERLLAIAQSKKNLFSGRLKNPEEFIKLVEFFETNIVYQEYQYQEFDLAPSEREKERLAKEWQDKGYSDAFFGYDNLKRKYILSVKKPVPHNITEEEVPLIKRLADATENPCEILAALDKTGAYSIYDITGRPPYGKARKNLMRFLSAPHAADVAQLINGIDKLERNSDYYDENSTYFKKLIQLANSSEATTYTPDFLGKVNVLSKALWGSVALEDLPRYRQLFSDKEGFEFLVAALNSLKGYRRMDWRTPIFENIERLEQDKLLVPITTLLRSGIALPDQSLLAGDIKHSIKAYPESYQEMVDFMQSSNIKTFVENKDMQDFALIVKDILGRAIPVDELVELFDKREDITTFIKIILATDEDRESLGEGYRISYFLKHTGKFLIDEARRNTFFSSDFQEYIANFQQNTGKKFTPEDYFGNICIPIELFNIREAMEVFGGPNPAELLENLKNGRYTYEGDLAIRELERYQRLSKYNDIVPLLKRYAHVLDKEQFQHEYWLSHFKNGALTQATVLESIPEGKIKEWIESCFNLPVEVQHNLWGNAYLFPFEHGQRSIPDETIEKVKQIADILVDPLVLTRYEGVFPNYWGQFGIALAKYEGDVTDLVVDGKATKSFADFLIRSRDAAVLEMVAQDDDLVNSFGDEARIVLRLWRELPEELRKEIVETEESFPYLEENTVARYMTVYKIMQLWGTNSMDTNLIKSVLHYADHQQLLKDGRPSKELIEVLLNHRGLQAVSDNVPEILEEFQTRFSTVIKIYNLEPYLSLAKIPGIAKKLEEAALSLPEGELDDIGNLKLFVCLKAEASLYNHAKKLVSDDYFTNVRDARNRLGQFMLSIYSGEIPEGAVARVFAVSQKATELDRLALKLGIDSEIARAAGREGWLDDLLQVANFQEANESLTKIMTGLAIPVIYFDLHGEQLSAKQGELTDLAGTDKGFDDVLQIGCRSVGIFGKKYSSKGEPFAVLMSAIGQSLELNLEQDPKKYLLKRAELSKQQFDRIFEGMPPDVRDRATQTWLDLTPRRRLRVSGEVVTAEEATLSRLNRIRDIVQTDLSVHLQGLFQAKIRELEMAVAGEEIGSLGAEQLAIYKQYLMTPEGVARQDVPQMYRSVETFIRSSQAKLRNPDTSNEEKAKLGKNLGTYQAVSGSLKALYRLGTISEKRYKARRDYVNEIDKHIGEFSGALKRLRLLDPERRSADANTRALEEEVLLDFGKLKGTMAEEGIAGQTVFETESTVTFVNLARAPEMTQSCQRLTELTGYNHAAYSRLLDGSNEMIDIFEMRNGERYRLARSFIELSKVKLSGEEKPKLAILIDREYVNPQYQNFSYQFSVEMILHMLDRIDKNPELSLVFDNGRFSVSAEAHAVLRARGYQMRQVSGEYFVNESNVKLSKYYDSLGGENDVTQPSYKPFYNFIIIEKI